MQSLGFKNTVLQKCITFWGSQNYYLQFFLAKKINWQDEKKKISSKFTQPVRDSSLGWTEAPINNPKVESSPVIPSDCILAVLQQNNSGRFGFWLCGPICGLDILWNFLFHKCILPIKLMISSSSSCSLCISNRQPAYPWRDPCYSSLRSVCVSMGPVRTWSCIVSISFS